MRTGLHDAVELAGMLHHVPAFADIVTDRLFDIDIFTSLHGPDGSQGMPVIGGGDGDGINGLVIEDTTQILHVGGLVFLVGGGLLDAFFCYLLIGIAEHDHFGFRHVGIALDVAHALAVKPDDRHANAFVGRHLGLDLDFLLFLLLALLSTQLA